MRFGLAAYSFPWRCGFTEYGTVGLCPSPYTAYDLLGLAAHHGLAVLELPFQLFPDLSPATLATFRARADELGLSLVCDSGVVDVPTLEQHIPAAAVLGATTLRVTLSTILEGRRGQAPGGWEPYLAEMIRRLKVLRPIAEHYGVRVAPENHQDATTDDLLRICDEVGGDCIGVTLDAVNPLAVGEHHHQAARRLGSRIANVHIKDYWMYPSTSGYRLVRCAVGDGVLDLAGLLPILAEVAPDVTCNIELAALRARHICLLDDDWWLGFPPRDARDLVPALRLLAAHGRPVGEDWRTPFERGESTEALAAYEDDQMQRSVAHLRVSAERGFGGAAPEKTF
jgi:sugar phosphate isomerase/epimerase